jgi:hypothetical protein
VLSDELADSFQTHAAGATELLIAICGLAAVWAMHKE